MPIEKVRVDKWLWAIRIYKTRTLAAQACDGGKIKIDGDNIKPSRNVKIGETLHIQREQQKLIIKALQLIDKRVSAEIAQTCYQNNSEQITTNKPLDSAFWQAPPPKRDRGTGRPTKKERREIDHFLDAEDE